ncbi:MAG: mannose-1-phosphate guanylyltransferase/mannose-6-phosphate isomerase [Campylobacterota bacterium]|nr:mannose-1-phosphate guanylyltransferase/mannose-6-phosphate isomerase [Campylobacterota bacterium]
MTNIILCGGSGTRLWPVSRALMPKQFVKMFDEKSLFQLTVDRNSKLCDSEFIISNVDQYFLAFDQLEELEKENSKYLLEPVGRNTAPAITLACLSLDPDEIVLVTPSDHLIKNEVEYEKVISRAITLAKDDSLVTFGIKPSFAQTGFGYIEVADMHPTHALASGVSAFSSREVKAFHEKPDFQTATKYLEAGNYYWNSGMFCFKAGVFLEELQKYSPKIYEDSLRAIKNAKQGDIIRIKQDDMLAIDENSIDYAVMEKSSKVKVVPSDIDWSDVGSFDALYDELPKDKDQNTLNPNHISIDSKNNLIYGDERKIATIDIEDLIVVDTGDALLISKKGSSQKVKAVVNELKKTTELHNIHLRAYRPWGTYTVLDEGDKYKIKTITVKPGKRLSLQKHLHRSEHWIVVTGTAIVTIGEREHTVRANESVYIPIGEKHRLENQGKLDLVLIEAQIGEYLGEDDIIRFKDDYDRL